MTAGRGEDWGRVGDLPAGALVMERDRDVRAAVEAARRAGEPVPVIGLTGGDLRRTLGGTRDEAALRRGPVAMFEVDLGCALLDGRQHWFVAHLIARAPMWRGRWVAVMNAQWLGPWDLAPAAHPGDGRLDILDGRLALRDRVAARRRVRTGTHVPHPDIVSRRVPAWQTDLHPPRRVVLDGDEVGPATTNLSVRVEPGALVVAV